MARRCCYCPSARRAFRAGAEKAELKQVGPLKAELDELHVECARLRGVIAGQEAEIERIRGAVIPVPHPEPVPIVGPGWAVLWSFILLALAVGVTKIGLGQ